MFVNRKTVDMSNWREACYDYSFKNSVFQKVTKTFKTFREWVSSMRHICLLQWLHSNYRPRINFDDFLTSSLGHLLVLFLPVPFCASISSDVIGSGSFFSGRNNVLWKPPTIHISVSVPRIWWWNQSRGNARTTQNFSVHRKKLHLLTYLREKAVNNKGNNLKIECEVTADGRHALLWVIRPQRTCRLLIRKH